MKHVALVRLHLPDGGGEAFESELAEALKAHLEPGDIVFGTWRFDGHPDHESVGRAVTAVAGALDLPFVEVPGVDLALGDARRFPRAVEPSAPHRAG